MHGDIERVLYHRDEIAARVAELGQIISRDLTTLIEQSARNNGNAGNQAEGETPSQGDVEGEIVLVPVLTGSLVFVADLVRHLPQKLRIGVVSVSSYPGKSTHSRGASMRSALPGSLRDKHVLIVDDILDSGQTMSLLRSIISEQEPASLRACVMLRKLREDLDRPRVPVEYVGFDIPNDFVVGYGLDYNDYYRNLPDIVTLRREAL